MLCACSAREEDQWKTELLRSSKLDTAPKTRSDPTFLALEMRSLGGIFGQPGTLSRQMAMQRAATVDRRKNGCQVIIKNTHSVKEGQDTPKLQSTSVHRSHSLLSANRTPVFAPERAERVRLEHVLEDVWTRDMLPFPGMITNRGGAFIRASKNSVMRKLSKASTASPSSKRSVSYTSTVNPVVDGDGDEDQHVTQHVLEEYMHPENDKPPTLRSELEEFPVDSSHDESNAQNVSLRKVTFEAARSRGSSGATMVANDNEVEDIDHASRIRKPKTLLKAFSAEGIRTWFT